MAVGNIQQSYQISQKLDFLSERAKAQNTNPNRIATLAHILSQNCNFSLKACSPSIKYIIKIITITMDSQASSSSSPVYQTKQQEDQVAGFVFKAFEILSNEQYQKIIYWAPSGLQFVIKDIVKFQEIVLPKYFRHNKINSFVRQLNMYGFHKIKHNNFKSTFRHQLFQKDRDDLLSLIRRKPKLNDKDNEEQSEEVKVVAPPPKVQERVPAVVKQEETVVQKQADITQQFLVTTKMINMSLVKVTLNELVDITNFIPEQYNQEDCVSIEDEMRRQQEEIQYFFDFQDPACFFASKFDL